MAAVGANQLHIDSGMATDRCRLQTVVTCCVQAVEAAVATECVTEAAAEDP
jgi:hypothetical protein